MSIQQKNSEKGFTIIEVVLVLAIAGLIFLMVFIAVPALQRSQRDTARRSDTSIVASGVSTYSSNNRGTFPTSAQLREYTREVSDNTQVANINVVAYNATVNPADSAITVVQSAVCGASTTTNQTLTRGTQRQYAVVTKLEAGNGQYFCQQG